MQRDLQIIGDRIEFMGYHVGTLSDIVPCTVRAKFEERLNGGYRTMFNPLEYHAMQPKHRKAHK